MRTPVLPGPSALVLHYVDAPRLVTLEGQHGTLSVGEVLPALTCVTVAPGHVRVAGTARLVWTSVAGDARPFAIAIEVEAALIT